MDEYLLDIHFSSSLIFIFVLPPVDLTNLFIEVLYIRRIYIYIPMPIYTNNKLASVKIFIAFLETMNDAARSLDSDRKQTKVD